MRVVMQFGVHPIREYNRNGSFGCARSGYWGPIIAKYAGYFQFTLVVILLHGGLEKTLALFDPMPQFQWKITQR